MICATDADAVDTVRGACGDHRHVADRRARPSRRIRVAARPLRRRVPRAPWGRRPHRHRGLSLVHRLGPRHGHCRARPGVDRRRRRPRRRDPRDLGRRDLGGHDPEPVRGRRRDGRIQRRRRVALVRRRVRRVPRPGRHRRSAARAPSQRRARAGRAGDRRRVRSRHAVRHTEGCRCAARVRRARHAAHVDGRARRRSSHHAADRQAGRSAGALGERADRGRDAGTALARHRRVRRGRASPAFLERGARLPLRCRGRGSRRGAHGRDPATQSDPGRGRTAGTRGRRRSRTARRRRRAADAADAARPAIAGAGRAGLSRIVCGTASDRDEAYHQGAVWPWLIGPFVDAALATAEDPAAEARVLDGESAAAVAHLDAAGLGHVSEIADGEPPFTPRGCPFQAWSLGELRRARAAIDHALAR